MLVFVDDKKRKRAWEVVGDRPNFFIMEKTSRGKRVTFGVISSPTLSIP